MKFLLVICVTAMVSIAWISAAAVIQQDAIEPQNAEPAVKTLGDDQETSEFFLHKLFYKLFCGKKHGYGGGYGGYGGGLGGYGGGYGGYGGGLGGYGGGFPGYGGFFGR